MNNERIDLTQFEGMTKGPWRWDNDDYGAYVFTDNGEDGLQIASIESGEDNDASAIAKLPNLLAELKRCYDLIDRYDSTVSLLSDGEDSTGCNGDLTVVKLSACHALYDLRDLSQRVS